MGTIFARAVACTQSLKFGRILQGVLQIQNHSNRPSSKAAAATKTMVDHLKRMEVIYRGDICHQ
jgi:hypothetical protein